jgi:hypothetical protein
MELFSDNKRPINAEVEDLFVLVPLSLRRQILRTGRDVNELKMIERLAL